MNEISKVSDITYQDVADYLRLVEIDNNEMNTLNTLINVSKSFISNYTGRSIEELDNYRDFVIVVLILCQDMWDNRTLYVDSKNLNRVIYAHIKTTKGFTLIANNSDFEKALTNFTIRYPNFEINRDMIIEFRGKTYTIQYLNNVDEANTELEIQAKLVEK